MRPLLASLAICLLFGHNASGQAVGMLGDWQKVEFEGFEQVEANAIRHALAGDLEYQAAARPSASRDEFLKITAERITQGFRHSGLIQAKVEVSYDHSRDELNVKVDKGQSFTAGDILVVGNDHIDVERIKEALSGRQREREWSYRWSNDILTSLDKADSPTWVEGKAVQADNITVTRLADAVRTECADQGFLLDLPKIKVDVSQNSSSVPLRIDLSKVNEQATIGSIQIIGLTRHTEAEVLKFLEVQSGDAFSADIMDRICERLRDSCRFWQHSVEARVEHTSGRYAASEPTVGVIINLEEYASVPKLSEPLAEVDEALRKSSVWWHDYSVGKVDNHLDLTLDFDGAMSAFQGKIKICVSPMKGLLAEIKGKIGNALALDHAIITTPTHQAILYGWGLRHRFSMNGIQAAAWIKAEETAEAGERTLNLAPYLRVATKDSDYLATCLQVQLPPVVLVRLAHESNSQTAIHDGTVTVSNDTMELIVDAKSGRLVSISVNPPHLADVFEFRASLQEGTYATISSNYSRRSSKFTEGHEEAAPTQSAAQFLLDETLAQPIVKNDEDFSILTQFAKDWINAGGLDRWVGLISHIREQKLENEISFKIPQPAFTGKTWTARSSAYLPFLADKCFPRGSWPWTIMREYGLHLQSNADRPQLTKNSQDELDRLFQTSKAGPVYAVTVARGYRKRSAEERQYYADYGTNHLTDEAFLRDISPIIDGNLWAAQALEILARHCQGLDELESEFVLEFVPESLRGTANKLIARRKSQPDENPREALRTVLLECWRETWRDEMKAEFTQLANQPDDRTALLPDGLYPNTGAPPNGPAKLISPLQPAGKGLPKSLAEPSTTGELWNELK